MMTCCMSFRQILRFISKKSTQQMLLVRCQQKQDFVYIRRDSANHQLKCNPVRSGSVAVCKCAIFPVQKVLLNGAKHIEKGTV